LISTYGEYSDFGFLTELRASVSDLWCGDFGIERTASRCAHQLPRTAEFADQVALIQKYIRRYGDLSLSNFFHEVPVSRASHPPLAQYLYRRNSDGAAASALTPEEITIFERLVGRTPSTVFSFSVRPDIERMTIDPNDHHNQSEQSLVGGHPIAVFLSYILIGIPTYGAFTEWVHAIPSAGFDDAIKQLKYIASPTSSSPNRWSWFSTIDSYTSSLQLHCRRLSHINPHASERFQRAMELGVKELLERMNSRYYPDTYPVELSDLTYRIDDYITDGQIISEYMPRHNWH
jgi:hypothetical protein